MNETNVKICGLQDVEVLKSINKLPIDYIGFVFAKSRRQVSPRTAASMIRILQHWERGSFPRSVGVFVNPDMDQLEDVMSHARLDVIQLHGQESPEFFRDVKERFDVEVFKVISVGAQYRTYGASAALEEYAGVIDALLLDTFEPHYGGGSGITFAWDKIPSYQRWTRKQGIPLFVAGGLDASNVEGLIRDYAPDGVDISSGVETNGTKDLNKIAAFVERVKLA
ncbi:phosphoribosylanthranilate isomerase [Paenibacillus sp.]|jgi:phosphoribosylanthranilate isomerase|uniref:phosphoribosylanthranilate isomerase n=1 Tax=Paenibacillus sp. TaxID=58172 RepID=UPI0028220921|nr:phosphoribosylanthranilate isomerase [Paenibacillus sp.]MDR0270320.1 phosphoribosylanthranilate isomerase [Paenibacillus sp.]